ncbi:uncharacterized protein LOC106870258 [Octopus bimaculoides]|uniref:uncharacterized protein LOC106870258 n=1 Tax=Octopus bimaculoides TaxID=37653 RepID=UPI0022E1946A|nr:uncharacterized protein LOC106870258 [Octopus bimaculoides]
MDNAPYVNNTYSAKVDLRLKIEQETQRTSQQVERLNLEENRSHSTSKKLAVEQQQVETPKLEKLLQAVAQLLGSKWKQVGRHLGIKNVQLETIRLDNPLNTNEHSFQMLYKWYTSCDQEKRTLKTLREALEAAECFEALQCLPSEEK